MVVVPGRGGRKGYGIMDTNLKMCRILVVLHVQCRVTLHRIRVDMNRCGNARRSGWCRILLHDCIFLDSPCRMGGGVLVGLGVGIGFINIALGAGYGEGVARLSGRV